MIGERKERRRRRERRQTEVLRYRSLWHVTQTLGRRTYESHPGLCRTTYDTSLLIFFICQRLCPSKFVLKNTPLQWLEDRRHRVQEVLIIYKFRSNQR